jgi:hypothetical protein
MPALILPKVQAYDLTHSGNHCIVAKLFEEGHKARTLILCHLVTPSY